jgi:transcriptional regulator with XRE-family HTH domain
MIKISPTALFAARELLEITQEELAERVPNSPKLPSPVLNRKQLEPQAATIRKIVRD